MTPATTTEAGLETGSTTRGSRAEPEKEPATIEEEERRDRARRHSSTGGPANRPASRAEPGVPARADRATTMAPTTRSGQRPGDKSRSSGDEPRRAVNKRHVEETRRAASDRRRDRNRTAQSAGNQDEEAGPKARENDEDQNSANGAGERRGHASGQNRPERDREDGSEVDRGADRELDSGSDLLPGGGHRPMERRDARPPPAGPGTGKRWGQSKRQPKGTDGRSGGRTTVLALARSGTPNPAGPLLLRGRQAGIRDPRRRTLRDQSGLQQLAIDGRGDHGLTSEEGRGAIAAASADHQTELVVHLA